MLMLILNKRYVFVLVVIKWWLKVAKKGIE